MNEAAEQSKHHRTLDAIILEPAIMDGASARDWRVLHAIEIHQGYKTWRCKLSLSRIAEVARCSRKGAGNSCRWWEKMGVLKIVRTGKANIFEIVRDFQPSPERVHRQRHISQKRGSRGRFAPLTAHQSPRQTAQQSPPSMAQGSEREVFNEKSLTRSIPPISPQGDSNAPPAPSRGSGHASETSARPLPPSPLSISEATIKELMRIKGREGVLELLKKGNYPIPEFLLVDEKNA